jgi:hypothetical protein
MPAAKLSQDFTTFGGTDRHLGNADLQSAVSQNCILLTVQWLLDLSQLGALPPIKNQKSSPAYFKIDPAPPGCDPCKLMCFGHPNRLVTSSPTIKGGSDHRIPNRLDHRLWVRVAVCPVIKAGEVLP